jgi:hypothetical protein
MDGMAKIMVCETLEDMNELVRSYQKGGALRISWLTIPDTHFVKIMSIDEFEKLSENQTQVSSSSSDNFSDEKRNSPRL